MGDEPVIDPRTSDFDYDVCLSFAGEDRHYVATVAEELQRTGVRVFYDEYEEASLWGKDLYEHLDDVYQNAARFCVVFVSEHYAKKLWTTHERKSAQERALREHGEYILPARFDNTPIPGMRGTVGFIDLRKKGPADLAELIRKKLGPRIRRNYFPPVPDRLYKAFHLRSARSKNHVHYRAFRLFEQLGRMTEDERALLWKIFAVGCPAELPENIHISVDLLRRVTGLAPSKIKRRIGALSSLGFFATFTVGVHDEDVLEPLLEVRWDDLTGDDDGESTGFADIVLKTATAGRCDTCSEKLIRDLDFGQLSSATAENEKH